MNPATNLLALAYRYAIAARNFLYDRGFAPVYTSALPVVSVGNITAGGNGKTPLCLWLCNELRGRGLRPVILSRGYGGTLTGPYQVTAGDTPNRVGDEPLLMARTAGSPVVICRKRVEGARYIEAENIGNVIILDDGFQHRALRRSIDIVCVDVSSDDSVEEFTKGTMLPAGRLREPLIPALHRATLIVCVARKLEDTSAIERRVSEVQKVIPPTVPLYTSRVKLNSVKSLALRVELAPSPISAFCAIAHPEAFRGTLESSGFVVTQWKTFPDHHPFTAEDLRELRSKAGPLPLVCTAKDGVKIPADFQEGVFATEISSQIADGNDLVEKILVTCSAPTPS